MEVITLKVVERKVGTYCPIDRANIVTKHWCQECHHERFAGFNKNENLILCSHTFTPTKIVLETREIVGESGSCKQCYFYDKGTECPGHLCNSETYLVRLNPETNKLYVEEPVI